MQSGRARISRRLTPKLSGELPPLRSQAHTSELQSPLARCKPFVRTALFAPVVTTLVAVAVAVLVMVVVTVMLMKFLRALRGRVRGACRAYGGAPV